MPPPTGQHGRHSGAGTAMASLCTEQAALGRWREDGGDGKDGKNGNNGNNGGDGEDGKNGKVAGNEWGWNVVLPLRRHRERAP